MSSFGNDAYRRAVGTADRGYAATDLAGFFARTYGWMCLGLAMTGFVALTVAHSPALLELFVYNRGVVFGLLFGQLALVWAFSAMAHRVSGGTAAAMFIIYALAVGLTLSSLFLVYTQASIAQVFFVTSGAFGGLALYGATTKRDLSPVGQFMMIGLIGLVIAMVVNIFVHSAAFDFVLSCAGVLIFAGLTAYDNQVLRTLYSQRGEAGNLPLRGALMLYLSFINLFLFLLRLFGSRRD